MRTLSIRAALLTLFFGGFCLMIHLPFADSLFGEFGPLYGIGLLIVMAGWFVTPFVGGVGVVMAIIRLFRESNKLIPILCIIASIVGVGFWGTAKYMEEARKQLAISNHDEQGVPTNASTTTNQPAIRAD